MRFMVLSDTHGHVKTAMEIYKKQEEKEQIDAIIHLGDLVSDARALEVRLPANVISVAGNMDFRDQESHKVLETEFGKILLTHGHMENVKFSTQNLLYKAEEMGCKAAMFGHTHMPFYSEYEGIYLLNPGSLTQPRNGRQGTYAMLRTTEKEFNATILFDNSGLMPRKASPGVLKDMLNNSDRF